MIQHRSVPISEIRERGSLAPSDYLPRCPQAWHGGLPLLLVECKYKSKHRGQHRNQAGDLSWSGKLTDAEMETANALRGGGGSDGDTGHAHHGHGQNGGMGDVRALRQGHFSTGSVRSVVARDEWPHRMPKGADMKYVVQYRARIPGRMGPDWKDAVEFDTVQEAERVRANAVHTEAKGTKDWRVRPKS